MVGHKTRIFHGYVVRTVSSALLCKRRAEEAGFQPDGSGSASKPGLCARSAPPAAGPSCERPIPRGMTPCIVIWRPARFLRPERYACRDRYHAVARCIALLPARRCLVPAASSPRLLSRHMVLPAARVGPRSHVALVPFLYVSPQKMIRGTFRRLHIAANERCADERRHATRYCNTHSANRSHRKYFRT